MAAVNGNGHVEITGDRPPGVSECDVLIVGAGPAGLMLANWLSRFDVKTRIVDKRGTKIFNGQADGLQCRTLEIFDSFGFGHRAWRESNHMLEICLWNPDENGVIRRSDRIPDTIPGISRFQQVVLHQGRIERFFLDSIAEHNSTIQVERGTLPISFDFDETIVEDAQSYPITVTLKALSEEEATPKQSATSQNGAGIADGLFRSNMTPDDTQELVESAKLNARAGSTETVKAKYLVGCDGAHSWVRQQLGFTLQGESTDYIWGVLDIVPITDFPDIRMRCAIHSAAHGSVMVIPRENKLVRLYIQLTTVERGSGGKSDRSKINPEVILASAQRIMAPYTITYRYCDWWTAYQIGQRVGDNFSLRERVFLAGDAVHTHSPKAGQGMNVSMQDTYNLGWKLAHVIKGTHDISVLKTYQSERRKIAQDLIAFDHRFSRLFSGRPATDVMDEEGISMEEFKDAFVKGNMFASGVAVDYGTSMLIAKPGDSRAQGDGTDVAAAGGAGARAVSTPQLAAHIALGQRFPNAQVLNQADARPWPFQAWLPSDGRWRVVLLPGDLTAPAAAARLAALGARLAAPTSFLHRFTAPDADAADAAAATGPIELLTVHAAPRARLDLLRDLAPVFHPFHPAGGWDYEKVFVDDASYHEGHGRAYEVWGVAPAGPGVALVVRPDQHVAWIGPLEAYDEMDRFFAGFMRRPGAEAAREGAAGAEGVAPL